MRKINIFTIGFCGKKENEFYNIINKVGVKLLLDIRLWRMSRFVPWANGPNLEVVLKERYIYLPECAPTTELLNNYKKGKITWNQYEQIFKEIITSRNVEKLFSEKSLENACFLCAEENPTKCHRRLIAEYTAIQFANIEINHL